MSVFLPSFSGMFMQNQSQNGAETAPMLAFPCEKVGAAASVYVLPRRGDGFWIAAPIQKSPRH